MLLLLNCQPGIAMLIYNLPEIHEFYIFNIFVCDCFSLPLNRGYFKMYYKVVSIIITLLFMPVCLVKKCILCFNMLTDW